jgi:hypothetical protein
MRSRTPRPFSADSKYFPLHQYLLSREGPSFRLTFEDIEEILGIPLPPGARSHRAWWGNGTWGHSQSRSWLLAGWRAINADIENETVDFARE